MSTVLIFLFVIIFLVVAHELGHFFVAKAFKVKVEEFGVGYPPRAKKLFTWRGTLFTLNWLPFGGFVKIFGEEATIAEDPTSFARQKMWKRLLIIAAGVIANILLAMVLYAISFSIGFLGRPADFPQAKVLTPSQVVVTAVMEASPAEDSGIVAGDSIQKISIGAEAIEPKTADGVTQFVRAHSKENLTFTLVDGDGIAREVIATPKEGIATGGAGVGITIVEAAHMRLPFFHALKAGVVYSLRQFEMIIESLGLLIGAVFSGNSTLIAQVSGPVGIAQFAGQAFTLGFGAFISFMALISVNLAVINLLPFPALDGGRLILELFASKGKSRIPMRVVSAINQVGFVLLILLMLYVTYKDIAKLVT